MLLHFISVSVNDQVVASAAEVLAMLREGSRHASEVFIRQDAPAILTGILRRSSNTQVHLARGRVHVSNGAGSGHASAGARRATRRAPTAHGPPDVPAHPQVRLSVARALRVIVSAWERPGAEGLGGEEGEAEREAPDAAVIRSRPTCTVREAGC
jgi:hypothetical protein